MHPPITWIDNILNKKERTFSESPIHADFETALNLIRSYNIGRYVWETVLGWTKIHIKIINESTPFLIDENLNIPCFFIKYW